MACLGKVEHPASERPCPGRPCLLGSAWTQVAGMATHPRSPSSPPEALLPDRDCGHVPHIEAPEAASVRGGPGLLRVRAVRRAGTADAVSEAEGVERRTEGPALVRRRERPAKRAALNPYRKVLTSGLPAGLSRHG
jgi:hypothetical protein